MGLNLCVILFLLCFVLDASKEAWAKVIWNFSEGGGSWSPLFSKSFNGWELNDVESLLFCLSWKRVSLVEDRV